MKIIVIAAAAAAALLTLSGCATMTRGTHDAFIVQTDPSGAAVTTSNGFTCAATPCSMRMLRKSEFDVTISKPGYKTWTGHVTNHVGKGGGGAMAGNILVGGIIGAGVDASNGSMLDLVPNPLVVHLEKDDGSAPAQ